MIFCFNMKKLEYKLESKNGKNFLVIDDNDEKVPKQKLKRKKNKINRKLDLMDTI